MQCGYRETLVPTRDLATKQGQGNILFHDQLTDTESMTSARVTLTTFESAVFDGGAYNSLTDELVFTVCSIPRCVRDWQLHNSHRHAQRKNCRHKLYKMRNRRILTAQCVAISRYMSALVHVSAVDSQLEVRFRLFVFRFVSPSLI